MTELNPPSKATIQSYDPMDRVGRLVLESGDVLRFGETACQDFVPAPGLEVYVTAIAPYPLGGSKAVKVRTRSVTETQVHEAAAARKAQEVAEAAAQREQRRHVLLPLLTHDAIVARVKALAPDEREDEDRQAISAFVEELEIVGPSLSHVPAILQGVAESPPLAHFGSPGYFVHYMEQFHGRGYEDALFEAASRTPTMHFVWMLGRCSNAEDDSSEEAIGILRDYAANPQAPEAIRVAAAELVANHG